jgi:hypothetical protein
METPPTKFSTPELIEKLESNGHEPEDDPQGISGRCSGSCGHKRVPLQLQNSYNSTLSELRMREHVLERRIKSSPRLSRKDPD